MSTIQADVSLIPATSAAASRTPQRLPRLVGWMLTAVAAGAFWSGVVALIHLIF